MVAVRVGLIRDDRVCGFDACARDAAVQVVRDHHRSTTEHLSRGADQLRLGVVDAGNAHRAVQTQIQRIDTARPAQTVDELGFERIEART